MEDDPSIKRVQITAAAANNMESDDTPIVRGGSRGRKKNLRVKANLVGAGTSPGTLVQLASSHTPGPESMAVGVSSPITDAGAPVGKIAPSLGGAPPRVILSKTQKKGKVLFTAPKPLLIPEKRKKTLKKVRVNLRGLTRKLKKANKIRRSATDKSIGDIKKELIKMELVKPGTTAPEDVLRQIYSDVETMKKRAL
jgi:hypothetical protein